MYEIMCNLNDVSLKDLKDRIFESSQLFETLGILPLLMHEYRITHT